MQNRTYPIRPEGKSMINQAPNGGVQLEPAKNVGQAVIIIALILVGKWVFWRLLDKKTTL